MPISLRKVRTSSIDLAGGALAQDEVVLLDRGRTFVGQLLARQGERLNAEVVVLRRHREAFAARSHVGKIALFEHVGLFDHLPGVTQKLGAVVGQRDAAVAAREDGYPQLGFKVVHGGGQVRLRRVHVVRRRVDGAVFGDGYEVAELLQRHRPSPSSVLAAQTS